MQQKKTINDPIGPPHVTPAVGRSFAHMLKAEIQVSVSRWCEKVVCTLGIVNVSSMAMLPFIRSKHLFVEQEKYFVKLTPSADYSLSLTASCRQADPLCANQTSSSPCLWPLPS